MLNTGVVVYDNIPIPFIEELENKNFNNNKTKETDILLNNFINDLFKNESIEFLGLFAIFPIDISNNEIIVYSDFYKNNIIAKYCLDSFYVGNKKTQDSSLELKTQYLIFTASNLILENNIYIDKELFKDSYNYLIKLVNKFLNIELKNILLSFFNTYNTIEKSIKINKLNISHSIPDNTNIAIYKSIFNILNLNENIGISLKNFYDFDSKSNNNLNIYCF